MYDNVAESVRGIESQSKFKKVRSLLWTMFQGSTVVI